MSKTELKKVIKREVFIRILNSKRFDVLESFLIFGDARGGTTWLMELLGTIKGTIMVDEPLHLRDGCLPKEINFGWRQTIPKNASWLAAESAFKKILGGRQISLSALRPNSLLRILGGKRLIFKFARGTALLPWLCRHFEFQYKPIYLLRHPIAVASSQIKNFPTSAKFRPFKIPDQPFNKIFLDHMDLLSSCQSRLEQLVALWCLHNYSTLRDQDAKWQKFYYEDLFIEPETHLNKIFLEWNMQLPSPILSRIDNPSYSDFHNDLRKDKKEQLSKWQDRIGKAELDKIQVILDHFGILDYKAHDALPIGCNSKGF